MKKPKLDKWTLNEMETEAPGSTARLMKILAREPKLVPILEGIDMTHTIECSEGHPVYAAFKRAIDPYVGWGRARVQGFGPLESNPKDWLTSSEAYVTIIEYSSWAQSKAAYKPYSRAHGALHGCDENMEPWEERVRVDGVWQRI